MKSLKKTLFLVLLFFNLNGFAAIWYVNQNASGANTGISWTNAFTDLQDAISASSYGDEIWVAAGTYKPTSTTSRSISFSIKNGTKVYGGFDGTENTESQRNSELNITILSGEIASGSLTDNSYNVVYFSNVSNQTEIDGFTIVAGYTSGGSGGGIRSANSSPTIGHCKITGNLADIGGGISHGSSGNITIHDCIFEGNIASTQGGAINIFVGTNNLISNCYFRSNQSSGIAGILSVIGTSSTSATVSNCVMANNTSNSSGIYFNSSSLVNLYNCLIVGNYSTTTGIIRTETASSSKANKIVNCTIAHNNQGVSTGTANTSVALNAQSSIYNSIIYGNNSLSQVLGTGVTLSNCILQAGTSSASGTNVLSSNPEFISPGTFATAPFDTTGLNYQLKAISPGINYGLNSSVVGTFDLDGNARIQNTTVDLGAYESNFCNSNITFSQPAPYTICAGSPITLQVNGATDLLWSNGNTNSSISVATAGTYTVLFEDTLGCRGSLSATVTSSSNPAPNITFSGGSLNVGSFANYQWFFNSNSISSATGSSHVPFQGYGIYSIEVANTGGCIGSASYCFSPATLTATGPTTFCIGESVTLNITNGNTIVWSNGELDSSITVSTSGTYTANVYNNLAGCSSVFQQVVSVVALPNPFLTYSNGQISTSSFSTYQWNFNGTPISGANSAILVPNQGNGQYSVTVTNSSGCEATSANYNFNNVGIKENTLSFIRISPNPIQNGQQLKFHFDEQIAGNVKISILDAKGSQKWVVENAEMPENLEIPSLETGIYFITIEKTEGEIKKFKFSVL